MNGRLVRFHFVDGETRGMDPLVQGLQALGLLILIFVMVVHLSVHAAASAGRLAPDLPPWLRFVKWTAGRPNDEPDLGGATFGVVLVCLMQIFPFGLLLAPTAQLGVPARITALGCLAAQATWFAYLRRYLLPRS